ncbi:1701_t:CDS:2, partial [Racocetra persica]
PPHIQSKDILLLYMIDYQDDNSDWSDKIEKYFAYPNDSIFNNIIYKTYFESYEIKSTRPSSAGNEIAALNVGGKTIHSALRNSFK